MRLDEEIKQAKYEKAIEEEANKNLGFLVDGETLSESEKLGMKYAPEAEALREYNYLGVINELAKARIYKPEKLIEFREVISTAKRLTESDDYSDVKLGYTALAEAKAICEASSAMKKAYKHGGEDIYDLTIGRGIGRIKDEKSKRAAIAAMKAGRKDVAADHFVGERKYNQAANNITKKMSSMLDKGYDVKPEDKPEKK